MKYSLIVSLVLVILGTAISRGQSAPSWTQGPPPMGWSSWSSTWNDTKKKFNESYIEAQAKVMAARLKPSGYVYINLDADWNRGCDDHGRPLPDKAKFPRGIDGLAQFLHAKGLKLGIYLQPGLSEDIWNGNGTVLGTQIHLHDIADLSRQGNTTGHAHAIDYTKPGATAYIQSCADLLAFWGVDYIKMDFVGPGGGNVPADTREDIRQWHAAILKTGRPIWLELSNSLDIGNITTWKACSNGWRIEGDIEAYTEGPDLTVWPHVQDRFNDVPKWVSFAGPGNWNDLDSLEVGQGSADGLNPEERKTTVTLWAISCAPLLLGPDLRKLDGGDLTLLTNPEVIAVDQAGHPASPLDQKTPQQVWFARNPDGSMVVALFNLGNSTAKISVEWNALGLPDSVSVRDLWAKHDLGAIPRSYEATLPPHGCQLLKVRR
jgi:hypothetical protein